jgi:hypothetical protein
MFDKNIWYSLGLITGVVFKFFVVVVCSVGFAWNLWNKEIPYLPVILFLVYQIWGKIYVVYEAIVYIAQNPPKDTLTPSEIEKLINLINFKNLNGGGPN